MYREIGEIPDAIERLLSLGAAQMHEAARDIVDRDPALMVTVARGSSDHAASYLKYVLELTAGIPVASLAPSIASVYRRSLRLDRAVCLSISQSGKSPDIVEASRMAARQGALTLALTNDPRSDLAEVSEHTLELHAGEELCVAATKTFVASAVSAVWLVAEMQRDRALLDAVYALPKVLRAAAQSDWGSLERELVGATSLFCLGRGPAFAIAGEAALKFKETCLLHAEAYSSAEVLHGPVSIVDHGYPIIAFCAADAAKKGLVEVAEKLAAKGAKVFVTSTTTEHAACLMPVRTCHPLTDPIALIVSFYAMVEKLAASRGIDPDAPRHLMKVTQTV